MLTKKNMIQAARENIQNFNKLDWGSAAAFRCALLAHQFGSMALGAAQEPWDEATADEGEFLRRTAAELMQMAVEAQLDAEDD
jgi:hypothetical protein